MSPPIREGSGDSIGSIRLGDGTEISEVRTGAGDVVFSAVPDSVVNWTPDGVSSGVPKKQGVYFNTTVDWPEFSATLGDNSGGVSTAYIYEKSDTSSPIATKGISGVGGGGSFTIDVSLSSGKDYVLVADDNDTNYQYDFENSGSGFPKTSSDGNLTLENGFKVADDGSTTIAPPHVFKGIGNV
jgi:hypothetical protein